MIGFSAVAQNKVGDWVTYKITSFTETGEIRSGTETFKVLKIDKESDRVLLQSTVIEKTGTYRSEKIFWVESDVLFDRAEGESIVSECGREGFNGIPETVQVPAGNFAACRLNYISELSPTWYGAVPFGLVKSAYDTQWHKDGKFISVTLTKELLEFSKR